MARYVSQRNVTSVDNGKLDAYWVHNMMLGYQATRDLKLQLNLDNLFDKAYVERVRQVYGNQSRSGHRVWATVARRFFRRSTRSTAGRPWKPAPTFAWAPVLPGDFL